MAKLLKEFVALDCDKTIIESAEKENKPAVLKALLQRSDSPNQNKRIYPRQILEREVENYKKIVEQKRATGELDHPDSSVVNLKNVSHIIDSIWMEPNGEVFGDVRILNTPEGDRVKSLIKDGVLLGVSSRGVGETMKNEDGYDVVDESFMLIAFDIVSEPSTHEAFLMREGKEVSLDSVREMVPKPYRINRIANEILKEE